MVAAVTRADTTARDLLAAVALVMLNGGLLVLCALVVVLLVVLAVTGAVQRRRDRKAKAVVRQAYDDEVQARMGALLPAQRGRER